MTKTKALAILAAIAIAVLVSALEKRRAVSAYCVGIILEENESGVFCNFVTAKLEGDDSDVAVNIIRCSGDFKTALDTIEKSDISLFLPTVKAIFIDKNISVQNLEKSITEMLAAPSLPPDAAIVRADNPSKLAEEKEISSDLAGALFIPKLVKDRNNKISLVKFAESHPSIAPEVAYSDGRFYIVEESEN